MGLSSRVASLADALARIALLLVWKWRATGGPHTRINWYGGHTNAIIEGTGGLEQRDDVAVGVSLLAPEVRYPDQSHSPE